MTDAAIDPTGTLSSVRLEGDEVVIRLPLARVHDLRVSLAECPCRAPKALGTMGIRQALEKALGRLVAGRWS